jgi:hypothetical protein
MVVQSREDTAGWPEDENLRVIGSLRLPRSANQVVSLDSYCDDTSSFLTHHKSGILAAFADFKYIRLEDAGSQNTTK